MWLYEWEFLIVCPYSAKFGDHRHYGSGDLMFLIRHVTSRERVFQELSVEASHGKSTPCRFLLALGLVQLEI